jgi:hypothetical protein
MSEWHVGPHRNVHVTRTWVGFDRSARDPRVGTWTWRVSATNNGRVPASVTMTRQFRTPDWKATADAEDVAIGRQDARNARISFVVPARGEKTFSYSIEAPIRDGGPREPMKD